MGTAAVVGLVLALLVGVFARAIGLDRDRAFYPTVLIVVGHYYVLFAAMAGSTPALLKETAGMGVFVLLAVVGLKRSPWIVAAGLAGHGVFDFVHGDIITNPGVPGWWPPFCAAYDIAAAAWLGWLIRRVRPVNAEARAA